MKVSLSHLQIAANQFQSGNFDYAKTLCEKILENQPDNVEAINLIAMIHFNQGKLQKAIEVLSEALERIPDDLRLLNNLGNFLKGAGNLDGARKFYERAVAIDKQCFPAYFNLGNVHAALGDSNKAIDLYRTALKIEQRYPDLYYNLGNELRKQKQRSISRGEERLRTPGAGADLINQAKDAYQAALALNPRHVDAMIQLGNCYADLGKLDEAIACYKQAVSLKPDCAEAQNNLGVALSKVRQFDAAHEALSEAVRLNPNLLEARNNLGTAQHSLGKYREAVLTFRNLIARDPSTLSAYINLARTYVALEDLGNAAGILKKAVGIAPNFYEALIELATASTRTEEESEARNIYEQAHRIKPEAFYPRFGKTMAQLSSFYKSVDDYDGALLRYSEELGRLFEEVDSYLKQSDESIEEAAACIGSMWSFYILLFDLNHRELQRKLGELSVKVMAARYPQWASDCRSGDRHLNVFSPGDQKRSIKVGIVSHHFANHSDWRMFVRGWLSEIDRERFTLYGYSTSSSESGDLQLAKDLGNQFTRHFDHFRATDDLETMAGRIKDDDPDVLIYTSVGADMVPIRLACLRLARVQCAAWGNPITTGLPTIDYFLGSDLLEPEDAQEHYTEQLIRLPNLGSYYIPTIVDPEVRTLEAKGVKKEKKLFLCLQALNKYVPQYDSLLVRIAKRVPNAQFLFAFRPEHIKSRLQKRLDTVFGANHLDASEFVTFLPVLSSAEYAGLCSIAHVFLDTPINSGCLSTLDALEQAIPIVTWSGTYMRSRHTSGMLEKMGIRETIAKSEDEYVDIAVRLATDEAFSSFISEKITRGRSVLYKDRRAIEALESFLQSVCEPDRCENEIVNVGADGLPTESASGAKRVP